MTTKFIIELLVLFSILIIIFLRIKYELIHYKIINITCIDKINFKFLYISDLHEKIYKNNNQYLIDDLNKQNIDTLIIGGDLIICSKNNKSINKPLFNNTIDFLYKIKNLTNIKNIYYGLGNHELNFYNNNKLLFNNFKTKLEKINIKLLYNEKINIKNDICLYSINLDNNYYKKCLNFNKKKSILTNENIERFIGKINKNKYNIILCHNPDFSENLIEYGFDFVLSAHTHGGLFQLPIIGAVFSPEFMIFPKYSKGLYKYKNKYIFVSSGLGEHTMHIRLNNLPAVYNINIGDI